jgi:hypothetical protein
MRPLFGQGIDDLCGEGRNLVRVSGDGTSHEGQGVRDALRNIDTEFSQQPPDHVDQLRPLPDEEITRPMQRQ